MLHTLQCVSCQERFLFDESITTQPITAGGHMYMKPTARRPGEQGLYCPRCLTDNRKWLEIGYPRIFAEVEEARRKKGSSSIHRSGTAFFSAGIPVPGTMAIRWFARDSFPLPMGPGYKHLYRVIGLVALVTLVALMIGSQIEPEARNQSMLFVLMGAMAILVTMQLIAGRHRLREWQHLSKAGLKRHPFSLPSSVLSALFIILIFAVVLPYAIHIALPVAQHRIRELQEQPKVSGPVQAKALIGRIEGYNKAVEPNGGPLTDAAVAYLMWLQSQAAGAELEEQDTPVLPSINHLALYTWLAMLLPLGAIIYGLAYWGVNSYIAEIEQELPRPIFRDLGRLTPVALRDAQHALNLDDLHLQQVRWLSAVRNTQGGLSLHGVQNFDHVQVANYRVETDMYGRPVSIRVQDQFSTS